MTVLYCREGDIDAGTETNSNLYHEVYYHFVGTDQSEDVLCWRDPDNPKYSFGAIVTDDGKVIYFFCSSCRANAVSSKILFALISFLYPKFFFHIILAFWYSLVVLLHFSIFD